MRFGFRLRLGEHRTPKEKLVDILKVVKAGQKESFNAGDMFYILIYGTFCCMYKLNVVMKV